MRPREFDEGEVLDAVLQTFWARGYEGTSVDDLTQATGLVRASLYGAFGNKTRLFERAVEHYANRLSGLTELLTGTPSVRKGLGKLLKRWIEIACPTDGPRGCFLSMSAGLGPTESDFARQLAAQSNRKLLKTVEDAIRRGQNDGQLATTQEPTILAELVGVILQGIATASRIGSSRAELSRAATAAVALIG